MTDSPGSDALIFPLGHYLGGSRSDARSEPDFYVVRIGWRTLKLHGDQQLTVWALAHGLSLGEADDLPAWTRGAVEGAARSGGIARPSDTVRELLDQELLVAVDPDSPEVINFARACRARSLLVGQGNTPQDPLRYGVSPSEAIASVQVDSFTYELWKWAHACDNLWHACQILAAAGDPDDPDQVDPDRVLDRCLRSIQTLLAIGAAYLDEAREGSVEPASATR